MDIVFSIDSVLAALAISDNPVVVLIGGMIGILCMRGVAEIIIKLMDIIPELQPMAYVLIGIIALKLLLALPPLRWEMPNTAFAILVFAILGITIISTSGASESMDINIYRKQKLISIEVSFLVTFYFQHIP